MCSLTLAATSSARRVIASDISAAGLELLGQAARAQGVSCELCVFDVCSDANLPEADWLVASDVLYTPLLAEALARRCIEIVRRGGRAVVADPGRPSRRLFQSMLEREGLAASFMPLPTTAPERRALVLLHIDGEHAVSNFVAHAELEG